jgi:hypothetical protein
MPLSRCFHDIFAAFIAFSLIFFAIATILLPPIIDARLSLLRHAATPVAADATLPDAAAYAAVLHADMMMLLLLLMLRAAIRHFADAMP